jgi:von Willebrand factor type A domain/von Willebrand factor type A C-terminal domain
MTEFRVEAFHNKFLARGARAVQAVITVTAAGTGSSGGSTAAGSAPEDRSELLIVDVSGSMSGTKLREAKRATSAAIDCIPDGVRFGIITGNHKAEVAYPPSSPLAVSSLETRNAAKAAVKKFEAGGGTAMGNWIHLAALILGEDTGIRHAILLTDGKNESEDPALFDENLRSAEGVFQCDCRGVGTDWVVKELQQVSTMLLGDHDIVAEPEGLEKDFTTLMRQSLGRQVAEVALRVWTPQAAEVVALKQMDPPLDLSGGRVDAAPLTGDYATGSWGDEARDFYLSVGLPAGEVDDEMLAARVTLVVGGEPVGQSLVPVVWTDDAAKSTQMNKRVADAMGERELANVIQEAVDAHRAGDVSTATDRFGKAVRIANETSNDAVIDRISKLVEIDDPVTGRVRPKAKIEDVDMLTFETRSTRTSRNSPKQPGTAG